MNLEGAYSEVKQVVGQGEKIYAEKYQRIFEASFADQFAAIDVCSGAAFVALYPEEAVEKARAQNSAAVVHLVRVGARTAYQVSFTVGYEDADLARLL